MNSFDQTILLFLNQFSQHAWAFDRMVLFLSGCHLLKGGVLIPLFLWAWFVSGKSQIFNHKHLITTLVSCFIAMMVARAMALTLPFRLRPIHEKQLNFLPPYGMDKTELEFEGWSSFPSDHAVLFFALSYGLFCVSRKAGVFALAYTVLFIALPRIYLGLHYPTDILAGALIGVLISFWGNKYLLDNKGLNFILNWSVLKPEFFYPILFLVTYQIADMFEQVRRIIKVGVEAIGLLI